MAATDKEIARSVKDDELMRQVKMLPVMITGSGSKNKYGSGVAGKMSTGKQIGKDLEVQAYLEGQAFKPKDGKSQKNVTGGGLKVTKRFEKGGSVKSSASKRADGIAMRGKTRGKMV
jgi:hypothetical protein